MATSSITNNFTIFGGKRVGMFADMVEASAYKAPCCKGRAIQQNSKTQVFDAMWGMESESYQSGVANMICKKTVLGVGYGFVSWK